MAGKNWWRSLFKTLSTRLISDGGRRRRQAYRPRIEALEDRVVPATHFWRDNGGDLRWSNPANWDASGAPHNGEAGDVILVFPVRDATSKALGSDVTVDDIQDLGVNEIRILDSGYVFQGPSEIGVKLHLISDLSLDSPTDGVIDAWGSSTFSSFHLLIDLSGAFFVACPIIVKVGTLSINCSIIGGGKLEKEGVGTLDLRGSNSFAGTNLLEGAIGVGSNYALGNKFFPVFLSPYTHLSAIDGPAEIPNNITLTLNSGAPIYFEGNNNITVTGSISGEGSLVTRILGDLTLDSTVNSNSYSGYTEIDSGRLLLGTYLSAPQMSAVRIFTGGYPVGSPYRGTFVTNGFNTEIGSLAGDGDLVLQYLPPPGVLSVDTDNVLTLGNDNSNTTFTGHVINGDRTGISKFGTGTFTLANSGTFGGAISIPFGAIVIGAPRVISPNSDVVVNTYQPNPPPGELVPHGGLPRVHCIFDTGGFGVTIASLAGDGDVMLHGDTLTVGTSAGSTGFFGQILSSGGASGLVKIGNSTLLLGGTANFGGAVAINQGVLRLFSGNALPSTSPVFVAAGATLSAEVTTIGSLAGEVGSHVSISGKLVTGGNSRSTTFAGDIVGSGSLLKVGFGAFTLAGANTYTGKTEVFQGTLRLEIDEAILSGNSVAIDPYATFELNGYTEKLSDISNSGTVDLRAGTLFLTNDATTIYHGSIQGTGRLLKAGVGLLGLDGISLNTGLTSVVLGDLAVNGWLSVNGTVSVGAISSLRGSGSVGSIVDDGDISPGATPDFNDAPGRLTSYGDVTFLAGSTFSVQVNGTSLGQSYDQLDVSHTADLSAGPTLNISLGFTPAIGNSFTILTAADGITGTFAGLPDGKVILLNSSRLRISYSATEIKLTCVSDATQFKVSLPGAGVAGVPQAITVTAVDSLGNTVSDYVGTVHFVATDPQGALPADYTFTPTDFGKHTFSATFAAAGPQTLRVTDAASGLAGVSQDIAVVPGAVLNTNDLGLGSLRQAILNANAIPGVDTITFNIPGPGVHTIYLASALPDITDAVIIDGYSQPGASPNTLSVGDNAVLRIQLDGSNAGLGANGLHITAGNSKLQGLVMSNFSRDLSTLQGGIGILLDTAGENVIQGNFIGTDPTGTFAMGNTGGVNALLGAFHNLIGGTTPAARNLISGNVGGFFAATGATTALMGNVIQGNYVGLNAAGTATIPNSDGIDPGSFDTVGGTDPGAGNVISGNSRFGMVFFGSNIVVQGNLIGTDATGSAVLGNNSGGILMGQTTDNLIGGPTDAARNVIAGSAGVGIEIAGNFGHDNLIQGNYIGTDATGSVAFGNGSDGILVAFSSNNTIIDNIVSGNFGYGIQLSSSPGFDEMNNVVQGNYIGTNAAGTSALGNHLGGILISDGAHDNQIGGSATGMPVGGNIIAFNTGAGVAVVDAGSIGNSIRGNSIHDNAGLGIDLGNEGVTPNGPSPRTGPNLLQNFPTLLAAGVVGTSTGVAGTLSGLANTTFTVDFYANTTTDSSGYGEGKGYLGSTTVTTNSSGIAAFSLLLPAIDATDVIAATATDPAGNTSEFSATAGLRPLAILTVDTNGVLTYAASAGIANNLILGLAGSTYKFHDGGEKILVLGPGAADCVGAGTYTVTCPSAGLSAIYVNVGDRDDIVRVYPGSRFCHKAF